MHRRAVIDTNVWVSYFISARAEYLIRWILEHPVTVYTSRLLIDELEEVLNRPKFRNQLSFPISDFLSLHTGVCEFVKQVRTFHLSPDPDDDFLFDLCLRASVDYLVTSDKKLLAFEAPFPLKIVNFNHLRRLF